MISAVAHILPGIQMFGQEVAAGVLDFAGQAQCRVNTALLAYDDDGANAKNEGFRRI